MVKESSTLSTCDSTRYVAMGTKRFNWTLFSTLQSSSQNPPQSSHRRRDRDGREPSPRSETAVRDDREREREEDWRRQREVERMKERRREKERGIGQGQKEERDTFKTLPQRDGKYARPEKEPLRERSFLTGGRERWSEVATVSREREDVKRTGKATTREAERGIRYRDRQRETEREEFEKVNDRDTQRHQRRDRDMQRYRDVERQRDWERDGVREEYRSNGRRIRDREGDLDQRRERWSDLSPRYRRRDEWEEKEQRSERERVRERRREREMQWEREYAYNTLERKRLVDRERENLSDREGPMRKQDRKRDAKSEGDSEGETQKERVRDFERYRLKQKHSRSEGDNEAEAIREKLRETDRFREREGERKAERYTGRYRPEVMEKDGASERYRKREVGRDTEGQRDRHRQRERERETYEDRQRHRKEWREPEPGREGPESRMRSDRTKRGEEDSARELKKNFYREEEDKYQRQERRREDLPQKLPTDNHVYSGRDKKRDIDRSGENAEEAENPAWSDVERKETKGVKSSRGRKVEGERKQRREWTGDTERERLETPRQKRMWIEPRRETEGREEASEDQEETGTEREAAVDRLSDRYTDRDKNEGHTIGLMQEDRFMEQEENGELDREKGDRERDSSGEDDEDRWLRGEAYADRDLESENGEESERNCQGDEDGSTKREAEMDSTDESESEAETGSDKVGPHVSDTESCRQDEREERTLSFEDGFVTVSSGGEEDQEEKFEDCKEYFESGAANEDVQPDEGTGVGQMESGLEEVGVEHCEVKDVREIDSDTERKKEKDSPSEGEQEWPEERDLEAGLDVKTEVVEEGTEGEIAVEAEGNENEGQNPKVTVFCVIGQTLPRSGTQGGPPRQAEVEEISRKEEDIGAEAKESHVDQEKTEKDTDDLFVSEMGPRDDTSGIPAGSGAPEDIGQYGLKDGEGYAYSGNANMEASGIGMSGKSKRETESLCERQNEANRETEPYLDTAAESEGEREVMFTDDRKAHAESHSGPETEDQNRAEPDLLSRVEEQCEEEPSPDVKPAGDVGAEIAGSSEASTLELQKHGEWYQEVQQMMDAWPSLDYCGNHVKEVPSAAASQEIPGSAMPTDMLGDDNKDENTGRGADAAGSDREEGLVSRRSLERQAHVESDPNPCIIIQTETMTTGQTSAGGDTQRTGSEGDADAQEYQATFDLTKPQLSKSNSCPSPVHSPNKDHVKVSLREEGGGRRAADRGAVEWSSSFRDLGIEARSRRKGFRKTEKSKDVEEGIPRDRRTRVFSMSAPCFPDDDELSYSWSESELRRETGTIERSKKRNSKFYNAQLYQQYSEVVQNQEILRQSRSDTLSSTSPLPSPQPARRPLPPVPPIPHPQSLTHSGSIGNISTLSAPTSSSSRPPSPRLSVCLSQSPTLWRELPGVRNSRELDELNEDQRHLQEVVRFEVVTSEASYCQSLDIVVDHFVKSKQLGALLTTQDKSWLFSRLGDVRALSHSFLSKLEEQVENNLMHFTLCDIINRYCPRFRLVYVPYLTNQSYQDKTYQRLMGECPGFRRVVENLERSPMCQRLPLRSFLVLPFQRITRLKLLVQNIVKRTAPNTEEEGQAIKALKSLEKIIQESNDSINQMKSIEALVSLSSKVAFECRTLPLISQSRRLMREGSVTEMRDFALKQTERNVYMHLFNDYLLLSLQKEGGRFAVIDHAPTTDIRVEDCRAKLHSLQKNLFLLHLSPQRALLLRTESQSDKLRWMSALSRPHPSIDYSTAQALTQVQCIRAFVAQQPDELTLEKADVLLVHQQSSDGWIEGTRLSDRQRGWAPESHLEIIVSERARKRNLLDTQKITTATATY
ncbi:trichohyalin-like isoform X1 [Arapaima gigas]